MKYTPIILIIAHILSSYSCSVEFRESKSEELSCEDNLSVLLLNRLESISHKVIVETTSHHTRIDFETVPISVSDSVPFEMISSAIALNAYVFDEETAKCQNMFDSVTVLLNDSITTYLDDSLKIAFEAYKESLRFLKNIETGDTNSINNQIHAYDSSRSLFSKIIQEYKQEFQLQGTQEWILNGFSFRTRSDNKERLTVCWIENANVNVNVLWIIAVNIKTSKVEYIGYNDPFGIEWAYKKGLLVKS